MSQYRLLNARKGKLNALVTACLGIMVIALAIWWETPLRAQSTLAAGPLYIAPSGNDNNDCLSPATACATINKALSEPGAIINVSTGIYTGTGTAVVLLNRPVTLLGGWNATFMTQNGLSTINGQGIRRDIDVTNGVSVTIEHFNIQNGFEFNVGGSGIRNYGLLTINHSTVSGNYTRNGGAIFNFGVLSLNNTTVSTNTGEFNSGIWNGSTLTLNNSTVSGNTSASSSGIYQEWGTLTLNNSTVSNNVATSSGGGIVHTTGTVTLRNSIVAGNTAPSAPDCSGTLNSAGYNLIGDPVDCNFVASPGDQLHVEAKLGGLAGSPGYHPLLFGSPAIDAGNPAGCKNSLGVLLNADQRGAPRTRRCDIGAYEYDGPYFPVFLPVIDRH